MSSTEYPMTQRQVDPLAGVFTSEWLAKEKFPPLQWVVPGIIPEGLTLLAAPPKAGKSWMVLGLAKACSEGNHAFGVIPVEQRPVLYMALEDGPRRLQDRQSAIKACGSPELMFLTKLTASVNATVDAFLHARPEPRPLIILDTLGKARNAYVGNDAYQHEYQQIAALQEQVGSFPGAAMIIVHHTRKGGSDDFVQEVSGTQGLTGAADTIITLQRDRNSGDGVLNVTARDSREGQYALELSDRGVWELTGDDLAAAAKVAMVKRQTMNVGDNTAEVVRFVSEKKEVRPKDLADHMGIDSKAAGDLLARVLKQGRITKPARGFYTPVESVESVESEEEPPDQLSTLSTLSTPFSESDPVPELTNETEATLF